MGFWYPDHNDPAWWEALRRVAALTHMTDEFPSISVCEFMFTGRQDRRRRASVWLYKHVWTRRYLNLDDAGHAYRYIPPRDLSSDYSGRYVVHRRLSAALPHLWLWQVPDDWRHERFTCECSDLSDIAPSLHVLR